MRVKNWVLATVVSLIGSILFVIVPVSAGLSDAAQVSLVIREQNFCTLNVRVYPEKRIPRTGNWGTLLTVEIYTQSGKFVTRLQGRSDNSGIASFELCDPPVALDVGVYNFFIRGLSHLRKSFPNYEVKDSEIYIIDFTDNGKVLLAGETSNLFDNKINSLDASTQIRAFYKTDDEKNDLNREGKVNSLDFSNTVFNFYKLGD